MTAGQIKYTRGLMRRLDFTEADKEKMVMEHTGDRTKSLKEMNHKETLALQIRLKEALSIPTETPGDRMRNKIISFAHEMRWHLPGTCKIDMAEVDKWCMTKTGFKKPLDDLNYKELPKAVTMMEGVYAAYLKAL